MAQTRQSAPPSNAAIVWTRSWTWPLAAAITFILALDALAQSTEIELSPQRWHESAHGLSLCPPQGARPAPHPDEDGLVRFQGPGPIRIDVFLKQNPHNLTLEQILDESIKQFAMACPSARILDQATFPSSDQTADERARTSPTKASPSQTNTEPQDLPEPEHPEPELPGELPGVPGSPGVPGGAIVDFAVPDPKGNLYVGQAFVPLNQHELVMLQWTSPLEKDGSDQRLFRAMLASLQFQDPDQLNAFRAQRIDAGQAWLETVTPAQLRAALPPKQWLRIIEHDQDIGYMRVTCRQDEQLGHAGLLIETEAHWSQGQFNFDLISQMFASDDGSFESWSIRTAARDAAASRNHPQQKHAPSQRPNTAAGQATRDNTTVWAQTGVRSGDKITVTIDRPSGVKNLQWQAPPRGYLSQVETCLLGPLLADHPPIEMGFYAYCPSTHKLAFRTDRLERADDGSYTLRSRPSPDLDEQTSHLTPDGRLTRRVLPGGRVLLPTTESQLALLWNIRP